MRVAASLFAVFIALILLAKIAIWNECRAQHSFLYCFATHSL